jgi:Fur family ferric uptake transcriptional regulator
LTPIPPTQTVRAGNVHAAAGALRARGLRISTARRLVLEALYQAEGPVPAEQIAAGLDRRLPASDLASVYRNLEVLQRLGMVRHVHAGHGPGRYVVAADEREYLVCEGCERLEAVPSTRLDGVREIVRETLGYEARFTHFPLAGLCSSCARERAA